MACLLAPFATRNASTWRSRLTVFLFLLSRMSCVLFSFISRAFSVITGALSTSQIVGITFSFMSGTYRTCKFYKSHKSHSSEPLLQRADRVFGENDLVVIKHVVDVDVDVGRHRHTRHVA